MSGDTEEIAHAIAGAGGGALSMIVTYPLVTLSTLAQTKAKKKEEKTNRGSNRSRSAPLVTIECQTKVCP